MVLENLIECYTNLNDEENAVKVREEFTEWKQSHKRLNLFQEINNEPRSLQQFLHDSTRFENAKNKVAALMFTQNKARTKATTNNKTET
ncbi:unnamed protein product [Didymodactylos carnosus]|nr:unnamed protein product [Didymodactylos carnosus]CAF4471937.1 unnamed protein product [Didymodactylos carnosus]